MPHYIPLIYNNILVNIHITLRISDYYKFKYYIHYMHKESLLINSLIIGMINIDNIVIKMFNKHTNDK